MNNVQRLLKVSSGAIGPPTDFNGGKGQTRALLDMIGQRNGFTAFGVSLVVRPGFALNTTPLLDVRRWNEKQIWREVYKHLCPPATFFAEDVFGNQFGILNDIVIWFDVETGEQKVFAKSIDEWAETILDDYERWTGCVVTERWEREVEDIPLGSRLVMKRPFILGGQATLSNLLMWPDVKSMRARGAMALQLENVPAGTQVSFDLVE